MKRPLFVIACCVSVGIAIAHLVGIPFFYVFLAAVISFSLSLLSGKSSLSRSLLAFGFLFLGMLVYQRASILPQDHISMVIGEKPSKVLIRGAVIDDPLSGENRFGREMQRFLLSADSIQTGDVWRRVWGLVTVDALGPRDPVRYGDEVLLDGWLSPITSVRNPGVFDFGSYMRVKDVYGRMRVKQNDTVRVVKAGGNPVRRFASHIRQAIRRLINEYFDPAHSGLLEAVTIGDRTRIPKAVREEFVKTGTVHILAISGLHVALVGGIFLALFRAVRIPRKAGYALAVIAVALYALVAGANPPVVRSSIMFSIIALGCVIGRDPDGLNSLGAAALLILLWSPKALFDPSFQLSFAAILSLIVLTPRFTELFRWRRAGPAGATPPASPRTPLARARSYLIESTAASCAACIGTAPLIAQYFNIVSFVALIANLVIIPLVFVLMASLLAFLAAGAVSLPFTPLLAFLTSWIEQALFVANGIFSRLPFSFTRVGAPSAIGVVFSYAVMGILASRRSSFGIKNIRLSKRQLIIVALIVANLAVWRSAGLSRDHGLRATFLDVGHGDAAFLEIPGGGTMLVDGGSGGGEDRLDMGMSVIAPFLWNRNIASIDAVVLTHPDEDHMGGLLFVLGSFRVGCVIDSGCEKNDSEAYRRYADVIRSRGIRHFSVAAGDRIMGFVDTDIRVLNPPADRAGLELNDTSVVLRVAYKDTSLLLCGDIAETAMAGLIARNADALKSDILKVPHHGGKAGRGEVYAIFLKMVSPKDALISVARQDRFNAPDREVMNIVTGCVQNIYQTSDSGAITVLSDGTQYAVSVFSDGSEH